MSNLGEVVATLVDEDQVPGHHRVVWQGQNQAGEGVASGVYLYQLSTGDAVQRKRLTLLK